MARYIDTEKVLNNLPDDLPYKASVKRVLMQASEADVVEVVRCKDCIYKTVTEDGEYNPDDIVCGYHMSDGFSADDFCSYGEWEDDT